MALMLEEEPFVGRGGFVGAEVEAVGAAGGAFVGMDGPALAGVSLALRLTGGHYALADLSTAFAVGAALERAPMSSLHFLTSSFAREETSLFSLLRSFPTASPILVVFNSSSVAFTSVLSCCRIVLVSYGTQGERPRMRRNTRWRVISTLIRFSSA